MQDPPAHLMIVDPYEGGHHGYYIEVLCRRWQELNPSARLSVVVNKRFRRVHDELVGRIEANPQIVLVEADFDAARRNGLWSLARTDMGYGRALTEAIEEKRPDRVVLLFFDHFQVALSLNLRFHFDLTISGIYFRPIIHYHGAFNDDLGAGRRLNAALKRVLLRLACRNPHLETVFSLDPFLPESPVVAGMGARFVPLPEPTPDTNMSVICDPETPTISLVGSLGRRKGVLEFLSAIWLLPDHLARRGRFVLVGPLPDDLRQTVENWSRKLESRDIRLEITDRFLNDSEIEAAIAASRLVMLPYRDHVGMSNLLVRAAKYGKPVLGPDSGLLGALIDKYQLGVRVDTTDPHAIMGGLADFLEPEGKALFDPASARRFASLNTETRFADAILTC